MSHPLPTSHQDNFVRWSPENATGMYESHFFKFNLPGDARAFWCRFTILQRDSGPYAFEVWSIVFDTTTPAQSFALKERFDVSNVHITRDHFELRFGEQKMGHGHSQGVLKNEHHRVRWNVCWTTPDRGLRHFPQQSMYEGDFPKTKLLSPAPNSRFHGSLDIDGTLYDFSDVPGMQGHNWGRQHAESWVWAHCNAFDTPGVIFEGVTSSIRVGPIKSPPLTLLHLALPDEEPLTINSWASMFASTGRRTELRWRFRGKQGNRGIEGWFQAPPERFVGVHYEDPSSTISNCLNSKIADGQVRLLHKDNGVWKLKTLYVARATAALEIGLKGITHGVRLHL